MKLPTLAAAVSAAAVLSVLPVSSAYALDTVTITYFTIGSTDQDDNHLGFGTVDNEVQSTLGTHGLPVLNTSTFGCMSNCFTLGAPTNVTADGEITYWSPALNHGGPGGTSDVTQTGSALVTLPFNVPSNFFPPNGTGSGDGGANGFQAATLTGTLNVTNPEQISFSIGADDMAFAYLDNTLVCDLGGVHADSAGTCVTPFTIAAGPHSLQVFFVDINTVQSGLTFDVTTQDVTVTPVPEPSTWLLMGLGLFGVLAVARRRQQRGGTPRLAGPLAA